MNNLNKYGMGISMSMKVMKPVILALILGLLFSVIAISVGAQEKDVAGLAKKTAIQYIDENQNLTVDIAKSLWDYAEVGLNEYKSIVKVMDVLKEAGFNVEPSVADIPTASLATWGSGKPVLGIYEDIDALPGVGHGCGHNLNTAAGVTAAIALKEAMEKHGIPGTIKLFINPAEEIWDVAPLVAAKGYYDDVDVLISFHAGTENTSEFGSTMAMDHVEYKFKGKAAHASASPEKGRSALDAVEIMNVAVNYLREHLIQEMRIHYVITDGGAAPNIVPATAASRYFIRGPKYPDVAYARQRIDDCAKGAALATGTELEIGFSSGIYNKVPNKALAYLTVDAMKEVGAPVFTDEDKAQMEKLGIKGVPTSEFKEPEGSQSFGSNPIGDVTWKTPSATLSVATWTPGTAGHSAESAKQSGAVYGFKGAIAASKGLAVLGIELLTNKEALGKVKAEFQERMKGMPPYEGKAMIPEVAYPEPPGVTITAQGQAKFIAAQTAFKESAGDKIQVFTMSGEKLAEYVVPSAPEAEYSFNLSQPVEPGQRLKIAYIGENGSFKWFYGYAHVK
ncbi:MAG TPA: amidohydrolase [Firmicutes bacterium]|nr:amidohydrolase [Bacillota bacterium]